MNFLLITVAYSLISLLWAKPQGFSGIIDNVDPGYNVPAGGYNNYNNYNNYQQQQQPQNCYEMQEKRLGQFVFTCHNNNYEPSACLSQQGLGQVQLGATQVEGNFLMQCYSPQQGSIGYKPVACVYNGQTYMPGQQFRMQQYGGGSLDSFTLGVCMQDSQGIRIKPAGCIDDYGRKYFRTSNMQIRGQNAQCIIDTNTNQIAIQLSGTYGGGPYGGGNYGGGNYGGYNNGNYNNNNNQDSGYASPYNLRKE